MSIATDTDSKINKYFKFANTNGSGTRNAYYTFGADAQTTEDNKSVIEFDFYMTNTGNENINQLVLLDSAIGKPKGNANYSGNYIFSFTQPKNSRQSYYKQYRRQQRVIRNKRMVKQIRLDSR